MNGHEDNQARLFEQLLQPHMQRLFRFAYRLTHSRPEAEDLFQDVLTKLYVRLEDLSQLRDPGPWLNRVLYNHFIDNRRRYARRRLVDVDEGQLAGRSIDTLPGRDEPAYAGELDALHKALEQLSDEHRMVVLLHDAEGYKLEEIQAITGKPLGTVKSRLHRARARLRDILGADGTI
ncbi:MAG: RNA polymerase sigma factor [Pseudomonadota bacterium]